MTEGVRGINKLILKFIRKSKGARIAKITLKKEQSWKIHNTGCQEKYKSIKAIWNCKIDIDIDCKEEIPKIKQNKYGRLIFEKGTKRIQLKNKSFLQTVQEQLATHGKNTHTHTQTLTQ